MKTDTFHSIVYSITDKSGTRELLTHGAPGVPLESLVASVVPKNDQGEHVPWREVDAGYEIQNTGHGLAWMLGDAALLRQWRDRQLSNSDWTQMPDSPLPQASREAWKNYRQELRDLTGQETFPDSLVWPLAPGEK